MFSEAHVAGILYAPIVTYCAIGAIVFLPMRYLLGRAGVTQKFWHTAAAELALYLIIVSLVILIAYSGAG